MNDEVARIFGQRRMFTAMGAVLSRIKDEKTRTMLIKAFIAGLRENDFMIDRRRQRAVDKLFSGPIQRILPKESFGL